MFSLSWRFMTAQIDLDTTPCLIATDFFIDKILNWKYYQGIYGFSLTLSCLSNRTIKSVPGVIVLESNFLSVGNISPFCLAFLSFSSLSFALRNRRDLCWFIFARGATPSTARNKTYELLFYTKVRARRTYFSWSNNTKKTFDVMEYIFEYLFFCNSKMRIIVLWMRARMDNPIHIQV